jgi:hypothetical protein
MVISNSLGITPPSVKERHGSGPDRSATAGEPAPLDQVCPHMEFLHETGHLQKVIAVIGITHDDIATASALDP